MTLEQAHEVVQRMKTAKPRCDNCERIGFEQSRKEGTISRLESEAGWEVDPHRAGYTRRCSTCANGKLFPWADRLDVEKVAHFASTDPRTRDEKGRPTTWLLELLKETL